MLAFEYEAVDGEQPTDGANQAEVLRARPDVWEGATAASHATKVLPGAAQPHPAAPTGNTDTALLIGAPLASDGYVLPPSRHTTLISDEPLLNAATQVADTSEAARPKEATQLVLDDGELIPASSALTISATSPLWQGELTIQAQATTATTVTSALSFAANGQSIWGIGAPTSFSAIFDQWLWKYDPAPLSGSVNVLDGGLILPKVDVAYALDMNDIQLGLIAEVGASLGPSIRWI